MKNKLLILLVIAFVFTACDDILTPTTGADPDNTTPTEPETDPGNTTVTEPVTDGLYRIRSADGNYLSYAGGSNVNTSRQAGYNTWYLRYENGGCCFFKANEGSDLLDLDNNDETEGNIVKLHWYNGSPAQRWLIEPNGDGTYQIRTSNSSGRVITDNGANQITIQTYNNLNTQKWFFEPVLHTYDFDDGFYRIRSAAGNYLSYDGDVPNGSQQDQSNAWYLRKAADGGYTIFKERNNADALDLKDNHDVEGNIVLFYGYNNSAAQRWLIEPTGDGSYQIRTVNGSGRVITDNGANQITIQTNNNHNTQKWNISRMSGEEVRFNRYKQIMRWVNGFNYDQIAIHKAEGQTNETLKAMIAANPDTENMIEGQYIVLHFPNHNWAQYQDPKDLIDMYDRVYQLHLELMGRTESVHDGRMVYLTDYNVTLYALTNGHWCVFSTGAANDLPVDWAYRKVPIPVIGHEIGHTMVAEGTGNLFTTLYDGESWNEVFNIYALEQIAGYEYSRGLATGLARTFNAGNGKYAHFNGREYDELSDEERITDILVYNTQVFLKFPLLLIENYGWDGIRRFMTKANGDHNNGVKTNNNQEKIDYLAVNLSIAYGMDLSDLLDYWRLNPSDAAKAQTAHLPKEQLIAANYGIQ